MTSLHRTLNLLLIALYLNSVPVESSSQDASKTFVSPLDQTDSKVEYVEPQKDMKPLQLVESAVKEHHTADTSHFISEDSKKIKIYGTGKVSQESPISCLVSKCSSMNYSKQSIDVPRKSRNKRGHRSILDKSVSFIRISSAKHSGLPPTKRIRTRENSNSDGSLCDTDTDLSNPLSTPGKLTCDKSSFKSNATMKHELSVFPKRILREAIMPDYRFHSDISSGIKEDFEGFSDSTASECAIGMNFDGMRVVQPFGDNFHSNRGETFNSVGKLVAGYVSDRHREGTDLELHSNGKSSGYDDDEMMTKDSEQPTYFDCGKKADFLFGAQQLDEKWTDLAHSSGTLEPSDQLDDLECSLFGGPDDENSNHMVTGYPISEEDDESSELFRAFAKLGLELLEDD